MSHGVQLEAMNTAIKTFKTNYEASKTLTDEEILASVVEELDVCDSDLVNNTIRPYLR